MDGMYLYFFKWDKNIDCNASRKVACVLSELNVPYQTVFVDFSRVKFFLHIYIYIYI